ncbi:MAG: type I restriction endonuclease subunit R [Pyrinomonadaceae bacterium]
MPTTDISEKELERIIAESLLFESDYQQGSNDTYDRAHAVDTAKLSDFLRATQPKVHDALGFDTDNPKWQQFLHRLQGEIAKRGVVDVFRKGIKHGALSAALFYATPTPGNTKAEALFRQNIFSVTRQLRYSRDETQLSLDLCIFINGLPVATFELKNRLTKQTVEDAVQQYKRDRDPRELLFQFGRCVVHFAVNDQEVRMCTQLAGKESWFLPFNKGFDDGAGNPPNPDGIKTDYLWKEILTKGRLTDILENYAQVVEEKDAQGRKRHKQIFPRYHQLDVVRQLLADAGANGVGQRYLVQHSAGSGKSNSIAWLAHQLVGLEAEGAALFDSVIVVSDRRNIDKMLRDTIKQFVQVSSTMAHAERAGDLRKFLKDGKKIIISTIQKFPFILDEIGGEQGTRRFAIIIDEAHSSQGGRTATKMNAALSGRADDEDDTAEDEINRIMESRRMLPNASYFAFTATPKNRTLEVFGEPYREGDATKHRPFHSYTMKQAIQEGFILDVLKSYTPVNSFYRLLKTVPDDPEFDVEKALKKLRRYVESHEHAIRQKTEIMVDHFHEQVVARRKVGGRARAMVVTSGIERAIRYHRAFMTYLKERNSPYAAIVAFSGDHEFEGREVNESKLNGFARSRIEERFREDPYRFLIVADKFQTGYDEPLLHTMYVDKPLSGIKAVQTLSRLNRAHPQKHDTFVLDFLNDTDTIQKAFEPYYRTTVLSEETDPNKLHDLKADLDNYQVYTPSQVEELAQLYITGSDRAQLDPILDTCVAVYNSDLDEDAQVDFKGKAKAFVRTYSFLALILPYTNPEWERLSIFLNLLHPKLPAPREEDLSRGILEAIDMDSYRVEVQAALTIALTDQNAEIGAVPTSSGGRPGETQTDQLSNIIRVFNEQFGDIEWKDADRMIRKVIGEEIPAKVSADRAYRNAKRNPDKQNARIEHDKALQRVVTGLLSTQTETFTDYTLLFKHFSDNPSFRKLLSETIFNITYGSPAKSSYEIMRYPAEQAEALIRKHLGEDGKWLRISRAIWNYFERHDGQEIVLSELERIASAERATLRDVLTVISLLAGPESMFIRRVYYRHASAGRREDISSAEVARQLHLWWTEKKMGDDEWRHWAANVMIGWEPISEIKNELMREAM